MIQISKIQRVYIENRKVLAETDSQTYALDIRLYQASEILPASFIQISQSEIVNIDAISHLKLTSNGLIEIYLKTKVLPTHLAVTSKLLRRNYHVKDSSIECL